MSSSAADAAGGEDGDARRAGHAPRCSDVGAGLGAVARDVRVDDGRGPRRTRASRASVVAVEVEARASSRRRRPDRREASTATMIRSPKRRHTSVEEAGIERGARADARPSARRPPSTVSTARVAQAAAHLDGNRRTAVEDLATSAVWRGLAREGAVEVDDVQPLARRPPPSAAPWPPDRRRTRSRRRRGPGAAARSGRSRRSTAGMTERHGGAPARRRRSSRAAGAPSAGSSRDGTGSRRARRAPTAAGNDHPVRCTRRRPGQRRRRLRRPDSTSARSRSARRSGCRRRARRSPRCSTWFQPMCGILSPAGKRRTAPGITSSPLPWPNSSLSVNRSW